MRKLRQWWKNSSLHEFINRKLVVLVKHGFLAIAFMVFTLISFYVLETSQTRQSCHSRNESRLELRNTLLQMVDLSDLFTGNDTAERYTDNRSKLIINNPALKPIKC